MKESQKKYSTETFIEAAKNVHGDRYDYSDTVYVNSGTKIKYLCKSCNRIVEQASYCHIDRKSGCRFCTNHKKSNIDEFTEKANKKHNFKFDYSKSLYIGNGIKIIITCKTCNDEFNQTPGDHLFGYGCGNCAGTKKLTTEIFIKRSRKTHGDLYDYSKSVYISSSNKIEVICKIHGSFYPNPLEHIRGSICSYCSNRKIDTAEFIKRSVAIHGDKYDYGKSVYGKSVYVNSHEKLIIICNACAEEFLQAPGVHIDYHGCPNCSCFKNEKLTYKYLQELFPEIKIDRQYPLKINDKRYRIDFKFLLNDKECWVEYNGQQHYQLTNFAGKTPLEIQQKNFEKQQIRDNIVRKYCADNNIILIEIDGRVFTNGKIKKFLEERFKEK